jgi:ACS family hexuronate transporter-like MFS transporter
MTTNPVPGIHPATPSPDHTVPRSPSWRWKVCGLLLLATMLNYMDRMTLNQTSDRIMTDFGLSPVEYGNVQSAFAVAFALGALLVGALVDRWNVYWIYPTALVVWSAAGFATGFVTGFTGLLVCRFLLGLAEAGNWPCALRTTQRILPPEQRTMGNGILQSGAAVGAVVTPLVVLAFFYWTDTWRYPFLVVGGVGCVWVVLWLVVVRRADLALPERAPGPPGGAGLEEKTFWPAVWSIWSQRRFWVLVTLVVSINLAWHFFLAWLVLFLRRGHHYSEEATQLFMSGYFIAADLGSLCAGLATLRLTRGGVSVHRSRLLVFLAFALLAALSGVAALLPRGPLLLVVLLVIGFGSLGVFPNYYSFSQELTFRHQGKLTGMLGFSCWVSVAGLHHLVGNYVEATGEYTLGVGLAGLTPLGGFVVLLLFWGKEAGRGLAPTAELASRGASAPGSSAGALPGNLRSPARHLDCLNEGGFLVGKDGAKVQDELAGAQPPHDGGIPLP